MGTVGHFMKFLFKYNLQPAAARRGATVWSGRMPFLLLLGIFQASFALAAPETPDEVLNFCLLDHRGRAFELRRVDARAVVLFFTANGCPVARQSAPKLRELKKKYASQGVQI